MMTGDVGLRQAALLLHATAPAERTWLLSQLEQDERDALEVLLDELMRLGLPADGRLLELTANLSEVKSAAKSEEILLPSTKSCTEVQLHLAYLQQIPERTLISILQTEPVLLIALVLRCTRWHWQEALEKRLELVKRSALKKPLADSEDFPLALKTVVLAALSERVRLMMASKTVFDRTPFAEPDSEPGVDSNNDTDFYAIAIADGAASTFVSVRSRCLACFANLRCKIALTLRRIVRLNRTHGTMKAGS